MATRKHSVYNESRESFLSSGVSVIDTTLEPLKVLRVMIEGLVLNSETGLWLTPLNGIPKVPRLSPFDLIYLDADNKVVHGAELLPGVDFPGFSGKASSALVLPFKTMSSSKTRPGDQLLLDALEEVEEKAEPVSDAATQAPVTLSVESPAEEPEVVPEVAPPPTDDHAAPAEAGRQWTDEELEVESEEQDDEAVITEALRWAQEVEHPPEPPRVSAEATPITYLRPPSQEKTTADEVVEASPILEAPPIVEPSSRDDAPGPKLAESGPKQAFAETVEKEPKPAPTPARTPAKPSFPGIVDVRPRPPAPLRKLPTVAPGAMKVPPPATQPPAKIPVAPFRQVDDPRLQQPAVPWTPETKEGKTAGPALDKEPLLTRGLRWLFPDMVPPADRRRSVRRPVQELVAYDSTNGNLKAHEIWDISATGIYLVTSERWSPGSLVTLTLQRRGPLEESTERRVLMKAVAVRWGDEGVGLRFVLPNGMNLHLWEEQIKTGVETPEGYVLGQLRLARALSYVRRICPPVADGVSQLLKKELSNYRIASAVEIALKAEELLAPEPNADMMHAHPAIVLRILEVGSWADLEFIQDYWAGILATSCSVEGDDVSNLDFVDLLSLLTPIHLRILADACSRATKVTSEQGVISSYPLYCSAEDLTKVSGTNDLTKIHRAMAQLADLGLLEKSSRSSFVSYSEKAKTTPTSLGLQMIARCNGRKEVV